MTPTREEVTHDQRTHVDDQRRRSLCPRPAAALVVTSAVSFAQESPTETPAATADADIDTADATEDSDAADDDIGDGADDSDEGSESDDSDGSDGSDDHGSGRSCPFKDGGGDDDTSSQTAIS